ncbi:MAG: hypothetical protein H6825_03230 [Planctomycetes bacterium]|nr:hypothetical protein [Planctomycetota bacterium]
MGAARDDDERRDDDDGNRLWVVDTARGRVVQKLYRRRGTWISETTRHVLTRLAGRKSGVTARARRATERRLLQHWKAAGCDVPADLTEAYPELGGPCVAIYEHIEGDTLARRLGRRAALPRAERDPLLRRFGAAWRARHDRALTDTDPSLVHEHGTVLHVLCSGERLVTFDLEQGFLPGQPVLPLVAKEVAGFLRSLAARTEPDTFRADLRTLVDAYGDRARLAAVCAWYLEPTGVRRLLWALDRARGDGGPKRPGKYAVLATLREVLGAD